MLQNVDTPQQSSTVYLKGGTNIIESNLFVDARNNILDLMIEHAYQIYNFWPREYFAMSHAPLVFMTYSEIEIGSLFNIDPPHTDIIDNTFKNN